MELLVDGIRYEGFTEMRVSKSLDQLCGTFNFNATSDVFKDFPIKRFSECIVYVEDVPILSGLVDIINVNYGPDNHTVGIEGRCYTSILVDSSVWDKKTFKAPINIVSIAEKCISDIGAVIGVYNDVGIIRDFKEDISAEVGETIFTFLEKLARQRQIILTSDGYGNLIMTRGAKNKILTILLMEKNGYKNNVLSASVTYDSSKRFHDYIVVGQTKDDPYTSNKKMTMQKGKATDNDAFTEKKLIIVAEEGIDLQGAKDRAKWEANIRRANSVVYRCKVQGHEHLTGLWEVNTLVRVVDEYAALDTDMLVQSVEFIKGIDGTFTELLLVTPDAYTLKVNETVFEKKKNKEYWKA